MTRGHSCCDNRCLWQFLYVYFATYNANFFVVDVCDNVMSENFSSFS